MAARNPASVLRAKYTAMVAAEAMAPRHLNVQLHLAVRF